MMMLHYSTPVEPSIIFWPCVGAAGEDIGVAAGERLSPSTDSCVRASSELNHSAVPPSTVTGWCTGREQPGGATTIDSKAGNARVSPRQLHNCLRSKKASLEKQDSVSADQTSSVTMFNPGGAPPPPGGLSQQLPQHKLSSDVPGGSLHAGRMMSTRLRHQSVATTAPGIAHPVSAASENTHENGAKQSSGPYTRTGHVTHDVHSKKRRQGGNTNGGVDAETDGAVGAGQAADDQPGRAYAQVRQPFKHARGGSRTRFDLVGDARDARGREQGERQAGEGGAVGLPAHQTNCVDTFSVWGGAGVASQPQLSPPPPPCDSSVAARQTGAGGSSCGQIIVPSSSGTSGQDTGAGGGRGKSWRGLSPTPGAPPPPPTHPVNAVKRACYSDQIIDNSRGLPCLKRLKAAFASVAEVAGFPDLIAPRYLHLARRLPPSSLQRPRPHHSVPLPPPAATAQPAGAVDGGRRPSPARQGELTRMQLRRVHGAGTAAATAVSSSSDRVAAGVSEQGADDWGPQPVAGGKAFAAVESSAPPPSSLSLEGSDLKQPPWLTSSAGAGRLQIMQDEMSEVSSVDSDDEMEDGEVAEEAARVQTHQQQQGAAKDMCTRQINPTPAEESSASAIPARVPPWVSSAAGGVVHALRPPPPQQQQAYAPAVPRSDGQHHPEQQNAPILHSQEAHQAVGESSASQSGLSSGFQEGRTASKRGNQHTLGVPEAGAFPADGEAPSSRDPAQRFLPGSATHTGQLASHTTKTADASEDVSYSLARGVMQALEGSGGPQNAVSASVPSSSLQQPSLSLQQQEAPAAMGPPPPTAASRADADVSGRRDAVDRPAGPIAQSTNEAQGAEAAASSTSPDGSSRPTAGVASSTASASTAAKPRPLDPRLTRQPKVPTGQQGRGASSGGTLQDVGSSAGSASADSVDVNVSPVGKGESSVESKGQPDSAATSPVQPATATAFTRSRSPSSGANTCDSASASSTAELSTDPSRYYVCSVDGSRVELKPPQVPAPGTLPESLANTCVARGKLPLLLDLDNTLLHAQAAAVTGCDVQLQDWLDENGEPELFRFELSCNRKSYYMKLRPHLRTFLRVLEPYYEMSVYTNATQEYADIVVAILDENRQLFSDRIVARNSGFRGEASENKAVRRMYENMDKRCIVAFDDRQNIWTDLPLSHVVKAQHYDFFDSHRAELNAYYPSLPSLGSNGCGIPGIDALGRLSDELGVVDEVGLPDEKQRQQQSKSDQQLLKSATAGKKPCDWDKHLDCMLKLFLHIHTEFFKDPLNANIGTILSTVQQGVLAGVGIFFTGYRKTYSPGAAVADCEERQAELAQRLGAKVYKRFDEEGVTHVVAGKNNTNNMLACRENTKLSRVHTLWLYCCEAALTRVPESAFDADALCAYYENSPPTSPYRDHWIHLAQRDDAAKEEKAGTNSRKTEIGAGSDDGTSWSSAAHQHPPLPPQDSLPVREFLGTGPYSDGATLTSPYEEIVFIWRPDKQTVRQLYGEDTRGVAAPSAADTLNATTPFGSLNPSTGVLLAPVNPGHAGGPSSIPGSISPLGPADMRVPGLFGERPVDSSVFTPSLHASGDEGLLENRRIGLLAHGAASQMHLGLPYE